MYACVCVCINDQTNGRGCSKCMTVCMFDQSAVLCVFTWKLIAQRFVYQAHTHTRTHCKHTPMSYTAG